MADTPHPPRPAASRSLANRPNLPRRQSRFTEDMTDEHTPAHSIYEQEQEHEPSLVSVRGAYSPSTHTAVTTVTHNGASPREYRPLELIGRGMNGCTHGAACVILVAIMTEFLSQWEGFWVKQLSGQAVALLAFLGLDTLLDILSLVRLHRPWPVWALLLRFADGIVYISMFMAYVAHGRVFPAGFTFWGMSPGFAGPVVYMFLWLLGVWNLCHIALRRHRLGNALRTLFSSQRRRQTLQVETPRPSRNPRWRRWIRVGENDAQMTNDIEINAPDSMGSRTTVAQTPPVSLQERPVETKRESFGATTRTESSHSREERGTRSEKELEKELEGGLSPPPRIKI